LNLRTDTLVSPACFLVKDDPDDAVAQALQARIEAVESEILHLTKLASETDDTRRQQQYWDFARDLQREASLIRAELREKRAGAERHRWWNRLLRRRQVRFFSKK